MTVSSAQFAAATTHPQGALQARRESRLEQVFRDELLGDDDEIEISGEVFHPADILKTMAVDTYRVARTESDRKFRDVTVADRVTDDFPAPVAIAFHTFKHGSTTNLARLGAMRDTWEALIGVCYALVLLECQALNYKLVDALLRVGINDNPRKFKQADLKSDSVAVRLAVIEGVLVYAHVNNLSLHMLNVVPLDVVGEMRSLNDVRNSFSHSQTKSETQAGKLIQQSETDLVDLLADLDGLAGIDLLRVHGLSTTPNELNVERLNGSELNRRIQSKPVTPSVLAMCGTMTAGTVFPTLVCCNGTYFAGDPFVYCQDTASGNHTRVALFKRHKPVAGPLKAELYGESSEVDVPLAVAQPALTKVGSLLV